jgi:hypothetical protein
MLVLPEGVSMPNGKGPQMTLGKRCKSHATGVPWFGGIFCGVAYVKKTVDGILHKKWASDPLTPFFAIRGWRG